MFNTLNRSHASGSNSAMTRLRPAESSTKEASPIYVVFTCALFFNRLPFVQLRPQLVNTEQFVPGLLYNLPDQSTPQYPVNIPNDRVLPISPEDGSRQLPEYNNYDSNDDVSISVGEQHRSRGHKSFSSNLAEELEGVVEEDIEEAIPGEPRHDYPVYEEIPRTAFTCRGKHTPAYYADVEARCQVFHICDVGGQKHSFLCPNGSVFNQKYLVCDWWYDFTCENAETLFDRQIILPTEVNSVSPNIIENDKVGIINHNEGFSTYVTPNGLHDNYHISGGFITDHGLNGNNFDYPNTQIDVPQQIFTGNNYVPQNDIFHGAETGFPGRDLLLQNANIANNNINENKNKNEQTDKTKNDIKEPLNQNQQNKYTENTNDKTTTKSSIENTTNKIQLTLNNNDPINRKQQRINRKGHEFISHNRNTNLANHNQDITTANILQTNNEENINVYRQNEPKTNSNNNNENQNFHQLYSTNQVQANPQILTNEKHDSRATSGITQQSNFVPPQSV